MIESGGIKEFYSSRFCLDLKSWVLSIVFYVPKLCNFDESCVLHLWKLRDISANIWGNVSGLTGNWNTDSVKSNWHWADQFLFRFICRSDYFIQVVDTNSHTKWQTVQIQISWLLQMPTDLDLYCLQRQSISWFSRTWVNRDESPNIKDTLPEVWSMLGAEFLYSQASSPSSTPLELS